jgi:hypothetical protein
LEFKIEKSLSVSRGKSVLNELRKHDIDNEETAPLWLALPHLFSIYAALHTTPIFVLELMSKHAEIEVARRFPIDSPIVRIGINPSCECLVTCSRELELEGKIAGVHCLLYNSLGDKGEDSITVVDNSSRYETYLVSNKGSVKVPTKVSAGVSVSDGSLICIGVCLNGPEQLAVTDASQACIVFRVRCIKR